EEEGGDALPGGLGRKPFQREGVLRHDKRAGRRSPGWDEGRSEGQPLCLRSGRGLGSFAGGEAVGDDSTHAAAGKHGVGRRRRPNALYGRANGRVSNTSQDSGYPAGSVPRTGAACQQDLSGEAPSRSPTWESASAYDP